MALRMWVSSTANALRGASGTRNSLSSTFSFARCFSSAVIDGLKYASSHEWVKHEGTIATVGVTDHAQHKKISGIYTVKSPNINDVAALGTGSPREVVFVELPDSSSSVTKGNPFGTVESVKASSEVYSPISGEVIEVNTKLAESPGLINSSPYDEGWMIKVRPSNPSDVDSLMDSKQYAKFCEEEHS